MTAPASPVDLPSARLATAALLPFASRGAWTLTVGDRMVSRSSRHKPFLASRS